MQPKDPTKRQCRAYSYFFPAFISLILCSAASFAIVGDQDGDGVPDGEDECQGSTGISVDQNGCSCSQDFTISCTDSELPARGSQTPLRIIAASASDQPTINQSSETSISGAPFKVSWSADFSYDCAITKRIDGANPSPQQPFATGNDGSKIAAPVVVGTHTFKMECLNRAGGSFSTEMAHEVTYLSGASQPPKGFLEKVSCEYIQGWSCDPDDFSQPLAIRIHTAGVDGTADYFSSAIADGLRVDLAGECGGNTLHGFRIPTEDKLKDGTEREVYATAIDLGGSLHTTLNGHFSLSCTEIPRITYRNTNPSLGPLQSIVEESPENCDSDSDGSLDSPFLLRGSVMKSYYGGGDNGIGTSEVFDTCKENGVNVPSCTGPNCVLLEQVCTDSGRAGTIAYKFPSGCSNGAMILPHSSCGNGICERGEPSSCQNDCPNRGERRMVVAVIGFPTIPPPVSVDDARTIVFGNDPTSVSQYYSRNSYSKFGFNGNDVFGPFTIPYPCQPGDELPDFPAMRQSVIAAIDPLVDFSDEPYIQVFMPSLPCYPFGGFASLGKIGEGTQEGFKHIGITFTHSASTRIANHEEGHNLGMYHSHSASCQAGLECDRGALIGATINEYGDFLDVMGISNGHLNTPHLEEMGWLEENILVAEQGEFFLKPIEDSPIPGDFQQLKIPLISLEGEGGYLSLETRNSDPGANQVWFRYFGQSEEGGFNIASNSIVLYFYDDQLHSTLVPGMKFFFGGYEFGVKDIGPFGAKIIVKKTGVLPPPPTTNPSIQSGTPTQMAVGLPPIQEHEKNAMTGFAVINGQEFVGELEVMHVDDFEHAENSVFLHYLNIEGQSYLLNSTEELPALVSGTPVRVNGEMSGKIITVSSFEILPRDEWNRIKGGSQRPPSPEAITGSANNTKDGKVNRQGEATAGNLLLFEASAAGVIIAIFGLYFGWKRYQFLGRVSQTRSFYAAGMQRGYSPSQIAQIMAGRGFTQKEIEAASRNR